MMKDTTNLIEEIARKQAEIVNDLELLKDEENIAAIEAMQKQQAELADDFERLMEIEKGENENDKF